MYSIHLRTTTSWMRWLNIAIDKSLTCRWPIRDARARNQLRGLAELASSWVLDTECPPCILRHSCAQYCDFIVWREGELFVQHIFLDEPFITVALGKCHSSNFKLSWNEWDQKTLINYGVIAGEGNRVSFHTRCLHITRIPKGKWYFPECRKKEKIVLSFQWSQCTIIHLYCIFLIESYNRLAARAQE